MSTYRAGRTKYKAQDVGGVVLLLALSSGKVIRFIVNQYSAYLVY